MKNWRVIALALLGLGVCACAGPVPSGTPVVNPNPPSGGTIRPAVASGPVIGGEIVAMPTTPQQGDQVCDREGIEQCISIQFVPFRSTPELISFVRQDEGSSGRRVVARLLAGTAELPSVPLSGTLLIWLHPDVAADSSFVLPVGAMRTARFNNQGVMSTSQIRGIPQPDLGDLTVIDDPRAPGLGIPDYVLVGDGDVGGVGWNMPERLFEMHNGHTAIYYMIFIPHADTEYPYRKGGDSNCIHFTSNDIANWVTPDGDVAESTMHAIGM